jgi:DNA polymerase III alpha subunit
VSVLPVFGSHFSLPAAGGILTLEEPGKSKAGGPSSIFDLAIEGGLKDVILVDERIDGFMSALKGAKAAKVKLCYGLKLTVCADATVKDDASLLTESKVIVFAANGEPNAQALPKGYSDLVRIWNRAATTSHYYQPRTSWADLKELWTDNLVLALPWASSFIAQNVLTFRRIVPDLPARPWVFKEVGSGLPFARLIDGAIDRYVKDNPAEVQEVKSIYYARAQDFAAYQVMRAVSNRTTYNAPNVDHLSSSAFSFENWQALCPTPSPSPTASP